MQVFIRVSFVCQCGCMQKLRVPKIRAKSGAQNKDGYTGRDKGKSDLHKLLNKEMAIVSCQTERSNSCEKDREREREWARVGNRRENCMQSEHVTPDDEC